MHHTKVRSSMNLDYRTAHSVIGGVQTAIKPNQQKSESQFLSVLSSALANPVQFKTSQFSKRNGKSQLSELPI